MADGVEGPAPLVPMASTLSRPPFHRDGWVYEEKVDGWRMLAYKDGPLARLISRNAVGHTRRFRELAVAIARMRPDTLVLDGEVAVYDEKLVSRFHLISDDDTGIVCTPPVFIAFDVLQLGGRDLRARPLAERRPMLEKLQVIPGHASIRTTEICRRLSPDYLTGETSILDGLGAAKSGEINAPATHEAFVTPGAMTSVI